MSVVRLPLRARGLADRVARATDPLVAALLEEPQAGVLVLDAQGAVLRANARLRDLAGPAATARGAPGGGALAALGHAAAWPDVLAVLAGQAPDVPRERTQAGPLSVSATPLRETVAGPIVGAIVRLTDVSALRRMEAELATGRRMQALGQLAGGVAHDFNNLLTVMRGAADGIASRAADMETQEDAALIAEAARRGAALVQNLLAFGRQQYLQPRVIAANAAVGGMSGLLRRLLGSRIDLRIDLDQPGRYIRADPAQLDQVLLNLAANARDAMPDGGELHVRTGHMIVLRPIVGAIEPIPPGRYVTIEVRDTGAGIPPDVLPRMFEPFYTTRRDQGGSGLGLATVLGIVRQSEGYIAVDSTPGAGTAIRLHFARQDPPPEPATAKAGVPTAAEAGPGRAGTILLVEDEDSVRLLAERALRKQGWDVLGADCADAALAALRRERPALAAVVTDMVMPGIDGATLIRILRQSPALASLPAVLVSGYADVRRLDADAELGALFVTKPYGLAELCARVAQVALPATRLCQVE